MEIDVNILIEALKVLPPVNQWDKNEFIFRWECVDPNKSFGLVFRKDLGSMKWYLIV